AVVKRLSGRLRDEALRVNRIVDELLVLSRIEGVATERSTSIAIHGVVTEAAARVRPIAEHRVVNLDISQVDPSIELFGDRAQLTSAVFNLLDNAVKYSESGDTVSVEATETPDTVQLLVRDHGIGIP